MTIVFTDALERQTAALESIAGSLAALTQHITEQRGAQDALLLERGLTLYKRAVDAGDAFQGADRRVLDHSPDCPHFILTARDQAEAAMIERGVAYEAFIAAHPGLRDTIEAAVPS